MRTFITLAAAAIAACVLTIAPASAQSIRGGDSYAAGVLEEGDYQQFGQVLDAQGREIATLTTAPTSPAPTVIGDGEAEISWGFWVWTLIGLWGAVIATLISTAVVRLIGSKLEAGDAEALRKFTENAVHMGLNAVANATRDKKLTFKTGSEVVEWALEYANQNFPQLVEQFGGRESQRLRTWARIDLAEGEAIPPIAPRAPAPPASAE